MRQQLSLEPQDNIRTTCSNPGCRKEFTWTSQPLMPGTKLPAGNFLICMATLFAGGSFTKMKTIFQHMGLACVSLNTFFKHQRVTCFPVQNVIQYAFVNLLLVMQHQFISSGLKFFFSVLVLHLYWNHQLEMDFLIFLTFPIIQYHYRHLSKPVFNSNLLHWLHL